MQDNAADSSGAAPLFMDQSWCLWHPTEGCVHFSDNWQNVCGLDAGSCNGGAFFEKVHPDDHAALFKQLEKMMRQLERNDDDALGSIECRIEQADGNGFRWYECRFTLSQMKSPDEHPLIVFAFRDIQRVVELRYEAANASEQSAFAEKGRRDFLTHMSHELRTPLNAILGFSQMIQSEAYGSLGNTHYNEYIENIRYSGEDLLNKINNLLELGAIDSSEKTLQETPINLQDLISEVSAMHSHRAFEKSVTINHQGAIPQMVLRADFTRMSHAIANLLENAINHAPAESTVTLSAKQTRDGNLAIIVEDTGGGIADIQLTQMMEAFAQARGDHNPMEKNIGVGLLLANRIAHMHGAELKIENTALGCRAVMVVPSDRIISQSARIKPKMRTAVAS